MRPIDKKPKRPAGVLRRGRVSSYFGLRRGQAELDFVNVDIYGDVPLFIDPGALRIVRSPWHNHCVFLLQNFFTEVLDAIKDENDDRAFGLLSRLSEPKDTHLGYSSERSRGHAIGPQYAERLMVALQSSEAARSGLLQDLEDTALLVRGIGPDLVSDMTTNIIRGPLIEYTQQMCAYYEIPTSKVSSGVIWSADDLEWIEQDQVDLPTANGRLLLVPRSIVRRNRHANQNDLYSNYVLDFLEARELTDPASELVKTLKSGKKRVERGKLRQKYPNTKDVIEEILTSDPEVFEKYKAAKLSDPNAPLDNRAIADAISTTRPNYGNLLREVLACRPGQDDFDRYERAIQNLLAALFAPNLTWPIRHQRLRDGIKIVDLSFTNLASTGFFQLIARAAPSLNVFAEAKNYSGEISNPEFDQLAGRFSLLVSIFGFLITRTITNRPRALERARHFSAQGRFIIALDDSDLRRLVEAKEQGEDEFTRCLKGFFDSITM